MLAGLAASMASLGASRGFLDCSIPVDSRRLYLGRGILAQGRTAWIREDGNRAKWPNDDNSTIFENVSFTPQFDLDGELDGIQNAGTLDCLQGDVIACYGCVLVIRLGELNAG